MGSLRGVPRRTVSDFSDQIEADALAVFLVTAEFAEIGSVYDPVSDTTYPSVKVFPQDQPDGEFDELRTVHADAAVSGLTWAKGMRFTDSSGVVWNVVSTGMNEMGITTIDLERPLGED